MFDEALLDGPAQPPPGWRGHVFRFRARCRFSRQHALGAAATAAIVLLCTMTALGRLAWHTATLKPPPRPISLTDHTPARYVLMSFHGTRKISADGSEDVRGINNIYRYALHPADGAEPNGSAAAHPIHVLQHEPTEPTRLLRGMLLDEPSGHLFVANAFALDSKILRFGKCSHNGSRPFVERVAPRIAASRLVHPYGLAILTDEIFATTQDTGSIVSVVMSGRAEGGTKAQEPALERRQDRALERSYSFGEVGREVAFRGLASFEGCLYAAEKGSNSVLKLCNGILEASIPVRRPVGVVVDARRRLLFVGSKWARRPRVVALELDGFREVAEYAREGLTHPAGIAVDGDRLLVAAQDARQLLEFDIPSGRFNRVVVDGLPDAPEWILATDC